MQPARIPRRARGRYWCNATGRLWTRGARLFWGIDLESLFDRSFYLERYPDVARSGLDPVAHFLWFGAAEGRQPHPLFDTAGYLAENPDVAARGRNPLAHFLRDGWRERRRPNALFDAEWYREQHPELSAERNPFLDYVQRRQAGEHVAPAAAASEYLPAAEPGKDAGVVPVLPVDVIIPVYRGLDETRACLESVLRARSLTPVEIVLVNDGSPEKELADYLRRRAAECSLTLVENASTAGFVRSVNRAIELHPERDVVLLNSDTEVAGDWVDRLTAAARAEARTGTATPFSNHATICSYPRFCEKNPLPEGMSVADLDRVFRIVNRGRRVPIPTAVGFAMYIRRDCLQETGVFNEKAFEKGYGEENDFCMRAARLGWHHVLAADVFVRHIGSVSFQEEADSRRAAAQDTLRRLHPEYEVVVGRHVRRDPARPYRFAASAWRLRHGGRPVILAISHSLGGGVEQHLRELRTVVAAQAEMLALTPLAGGLLELRNLDPADHFQIVLDESDYAGLLAILRSCGVTRLHVHHLLGHELDIEKLCGDLQVPFDFTAHDYFSVCPQVKMTGAAGRYCGEPDEEGCNRCLTERPAYPALDIAAWRERNRWQVLGADRVIAPSADAAQRLARYFPGKAIVAAAHPSRARIDAAAKVLAGEAPLRIVAVGVMSREKGLETFRACASKALHRRLPLQFELAGCVARDQPQAQPFRQTGAYDKDRLGELLHSLGTHLVWFPALWPETYSYTLSACLEAGLPIVAPDIGAYPGRLDGRQWSWIVPWDWTDEECLTFFLRIRRENFLRGASPDAPHAPRQAGRAREDFYPVEYLTPAPR